MKKYILKYGSYGVLTFLWVKLSFLDKDNVKRKSFISGFNLSQKFKPYPVWDKYIEPLFIKQFSIIFISGHSFLSGLVSDNKNKKQINKYMNQMHDNISKEIKESTKLDMKS